MIKLGKKGVAIKFLAGIFFIFIIILLGAIISIIVSSYVDQKSDVFNNHVSLLESQSQTRLILNQQFDGEYLWKSILREYNQNINDNPAMKAANLTNHILNENYRGGDWYVKINHAFIPSDSSLNVFNLNIPDFLLPNPVTNDPLRVRIKNLKETDFDLQLLD